jgi:hypothetical protein
VHTHVETHAIVQPVQRKRTATLEASDFLA